jgi:hypothetical protein
MRLPKSIVLTVLITASLVAGPLAAAETKLGSVTLASYQSASVPAASQKQIRNFLSQHPNMTKVTCLVYRLPSATKAQNIKDRKKANDVCSYAKAQKPELATTVISISTPSKSLAGKFLLTGYESSEPVSIELLKVTPAAKDLTGLKLHVEKLEALASTQKPIQLEYVAGPTTNPEKVKLVIDKFASKLRVFQLFGLTKLNMDWVIASEKDYEWWKAYRAKQDSKYPLSLWDNAKNELGHCRLSSDIFCGAGNGVNGKNYQDNVVGTNFAGRGLDYVTRHEATHFYQAVFGYGGKCWWAEGQATFFETYLESSSRTRKQVIDRLKASPTRLTNNSLSELESKLARNSVCEGDHDIAYDMGMLAFEYLYTNFSFQQVHDLQVMSSSSDWAKSVKSVLGLSAVELDAAMARYIHENWK